MKPDVYTLWLREGGSNTLLEMTEDKEVCIQRVKRTEENSDDVYNPDNWEGDTYPCYGGYYEILTNEEGIT